MSESPESEKKEDRRVRRTKKLMTDCLFRLMQKKQLKDISVRELADACDINRGTFYMYYRDIFDMLDQIENNMFTELNAMIDSAVTGIEAHQVRPVLTHLFTYANDNREMVKALLSENGDIGFLERLNTMLRERCRTEWSKTHSAASGADFEMGYSFVIFGCIGMLRAWVTSDSPVSVDRMVFLADTLLHTGVLSLPENA